MGLQRSKTRANMLAAMHHVRTSSNEKVGRTKRMWQSWHCKSSGGSIVLRIGACATAQEGSPATIGNWAGVTPPENGQEVASEMELMVHNGRCALKKELANGLATSSQ
eukprot:3972335-Amphidinium_carterae.1